MDSPPLLSARHLTKSFGGTRALVNGKLDAFAGEVHAIVGENGAGKSTLMSILAGVLVPDSGTIVIDGREVVFAGPRDATSVGVGIVHQELALCPEISVAENMFLGAPPRNRAGLIRFGQMNRAATSYLELFETQARATDLVRNLPIGQQQVVEIARTIAHECRVVIFDEPTSSLTETESQALFSVIADLKRRGMAIVYISHRMSEVFELSDRITVMRDGAWVDTVATNDITPEEVVVKMVGRDLGGLYPSKARSHGGVALEVKQMTKARVFDDISFAAHHGEILGFAGLVGSGRTEVMRALVGIDSYDSGQVLVEGEPLSSKQYSDAIGRGLCYMTEDRKGDGLFLDMSIEANTIAAVLRDLARHGMLARGRSQDAASEQLTPLHTKLASLDQPVKALSGGNQQKVMIAKWLIAEPQILILDEPTRGIDVGAKYEIHALLRRLADAGMAVIVVSSDLPEVVGLCDRVVVMREGVLVGELRAAEVTEPRIISLASASRAA